MEILFSLLTVICSAVLLLASMWVLKNCDKMEVSTDSIFGLALGIAAILALAAGLSGTRISFGYLILLMVAAAWAVRSAMRGLSPHADRRCGRLSS